MVLKSVHLRGAEKKNKIQTGSRFKAKAIVWLGLKLTAKINKGIEVVVVTISLQPVWRSSNHLFVCVSVCLSVCLSVLT